LGSANLPEILKFPIPGFSTFWFLLLFYLSTDKVHDELNNLKTTALTVLFSLTIYINAIDALFAVIFWFIYFPVRWWRRGQPLSKVFIKFVVQVICGLLVVAPSIYMGRIDGSLSSDTSVSLYYAIAYIALPLVLMSLLFLVQRIDPIEIIFNFRYIYAIMFAEVVVFSLSISGFLPLNLGIVENRIVQFFAHVFYFVPVIHFASRPPWNASFGLERTGFAKSLRAFISLLFGHWSKLYLPVLILLMLAYNFFSGYQYTVYIRNNVQQDVGFVK
jgi:hypothetical protein